MTDEGHKAIQRYCRSLKRLAFLFCFNLRPAFALANVLVLAAFCFSVFCASSKDDIWFVPSVLHQSVLDPSGDKIERGVLCQVAGFYGLGIGLVWGWGFQPPRLRCFLDKCCVDQKDEERKAAAVASFGGIIKHSDRLMVLWLSLIHI